MIKNLHAVLWLPCLWFAFLALQGKNSAVQAQVADSTI